MTLWLILAVMTAVAVVAVAWPLFRRTGSAGSGGSDVAVYRDQLEEVERDLAAGLIGVTEAEAARLEISRRLLAAADTAADKPSAANAVSAPWRRRAAAVVSLLALPIIAGGLYLRLGSPNLASERAFADSNATAAQQSIEGLVTQVEAHLQRNPQDGAGWEVLAPVYMRLDRYSDAVTAWRNVLQLLGESAERDADLGEALTAEANGVVTAEGKASFVRALTLDKTNVTARYYLGLAAEQDGQRDKAAKIWRDLIADAPPGAFWLDEVRNALARVEGTPPPGPSAAQLAAAAKEPPEQQDAMIRGMVDRLAARLKQDGSDVDGWVRLVRSYKVLGEPDRARAAAADARQALAGDSGKLQQLDAALKTLDVNNTAAAAAAVPQSGPGAAEMAAATEPPEQQQAMIHSMVDRLAARLKQDGSDVDGWVRLVRSYKVLGEAESARTASADARQALAGDSAKLQQLNTALGQLDAGNAAVAAVTPDSSAAPMATPGAPANHEGATIQDMVERLAERLKVSGSDPAGWLMLVRSYLTLGEKDKATQAISGARHVLADEPDKLEQFNKALTDLKIGQ